MRLRRIRLSSTKERVSQAGSRFVSRVRSTRRRDPTVSRVGRRGTQVWMPIETDGRSAGSELDGRFTRKRKEHVICHISIRDGLMFPDLTVTVVCRRGTHPKTSLRKAAQEDALFGRFLETSIYFRFQKKEPEALSLRLHGGLGCLSFIGHDCSPVRPVALRHFGRWTFGRQVMPKLLV